MGTATYVVTAGKDRPFKPMAKYVIKLSADLVNFEITANPAYQRVVRYVHAECMDDEAATSLTIALWAEHLRALPAEVPPTAHEKARGWHDHTCECDRLVGDGTQVRVMDLHAPGYEIAARVPERD